MINTSKIKINEIFYSLQGEGIYSGLPMAFIRVTGCNLRCHWCDTKYAYSEGDNQTIQDILEQLKGYPTKNVCVTGGEPLSQEHINELLNALIEKGKKIYLETNGSYFLGNVPRSDAIKLSLDIKCPSSGESEKMNFTNLELLGAGDQLKFIIDSDEDYNYAKGILEKYAIDKACAIIFTPCSPATNDDDSTRSHFTIQKLAENVLKDGLGVRVLPQFHKLIWPDKVRGV
jgi:7-carboxy-7-deazaguanine synthase